MGSFNKSQAFNRRRLHNTPCFEGQRDKVYINLGRTAGKYCDYFRKKGKVAEKNFSEGDAERLKMGLWTLIS